jgi:hypothetical protein
MPTPPGAQEHSGRRAQAGSAAGGPLGKRHKTVLPHLPACDPAKMQRPCTAAQQRSTIVQHGQPGHQQSHARCSIQCWGGAPWRPEATHSWGLDCPCSPPAPRNPATACQASPCAWPLLRARAVRRWGASASTTDVRPTWWAPQTPRVRYRPPSRMSLLVLWRGLLLRAPAAGSWLVCPVSGADSVALG